MDFRVGEQVVEEVGVVYGYDPQPHPEGALDIRQDLIPEHFPLKDFSFLGR